MPVANPFSNYGASGGIQSGFSENAEPTGHPDKVPHWSSSPRHWGRRGPEEGVGHLARREDGSPEWEASEMTPERR